MSFVCLFGFLTSSSTTGLYCGRVTDVWQFYMLPHTRQSGETMTSTSAGHIILTPTQTVGSGWPQLVSNPGPPHQERRPLPTVLPRPPDDEQSGGPWNSFQKNFVGKSFCILLKWKVLRRLIMSDSFCIKSSYTCRNKRPYSPHGKLLISRHSKSLNEGNFDIRLGKTHSLWKI